MMKKLVFVALLVGAFVFGSNGIAMATYVNLLPGASSVAVSDALPNSAFVTSVTSPFNKTEAGITMIGSLYQEVRRANSDGNLIYRYRLSLTSGNDNIVLLSTINFRDVLTGVAYVPDDTATLTIPTQFRRSVDPGTTVHFDYIAMSPGSISADLWIKTNWPYYQDGSSTVQSGVSQNVFTYGPSKTPEPTSMVLLSIGLLGIGTKLRRKFMA